MDAWTDDQVNAFALKEWRHLPKGGMKDRKVGVSSND